MDTQKSQPKSPLLVGLRAAKANFVPGLIVQVLMLALVISYYFVPSTKGAFAALAEIKSRGGYLFSGLTASVAGGILPELFFIAFFQKGKFGVKNFHNILFAMCLWGSEGVIVDYFYRCQADWFGSEVNFPTVFKKMLVDQFLYTPFFATPYGLLCYAWKNNGYSFAGASKAFTWHAYKNDCFPAFIAGWGVWIPLVSIIYSLPSLLQIPLFLLALTFWVMLFTYIATEEKAKVSGDVSAPPMPVHKT